jgi:pyrroline-5-carboxylate reductase
MKITFLGGVNMAAALIGGLLKRGFKAADVQVVELSGEGRARLAADFGVRAIEVLDDAALACDVLVLAVKPQQLRAAVAPIAGRLDRQLVVSIAAGLRLADIGRWLGGHGKLVRCMPNTPALIGAGITGLFADASVSAAGRAAAEASRPSRAAGRPTCSTSSNACRPPARPSASTPIPPASWPSTPCSARPGWPPAAPSRPPCCASA